MEGRDLVVCCDGTSNILGNQRDTNVVKLMRLCEKSGRQLVYYDPGVGSANTYPGVALLDRLQLQLGLLKGLAFGGGIYENIAEAYTFLVRNYRAGDRIWLFGFSRGAFTARAVSGIVNLFGIVRPSAETLLPTLLRAYFSDPARAGAEGRYRNDIARDMREHFADEAGREARIHFIGVWDTVATVGGLRRRQISSDNTIEGKRFDHVRHAVAEGEYRASYEPRLYRGVRGEAPRFVMREVGGQAVPCWQPSLEQVWFPGAHSDVGGSYPESGLSDLALRWMVLEAHRAGLALVPGWQAAVPAGKPDMPAHDAADAAPLWALAGLRQRQIPPGETLHPALAARLARERAGERPSIHRTPTHARMLRTALALGAAALLALWWLTARAGADTSAAHLAWAQLAAAWRPEALARYAGPGLAALLWLDGVLIASYAFLMCHAAVWSARRLHLAREGDRHFHRRMQWALMLPIWCAVAADVAENLLTAAVAQAPVHGGAAAALSFAAAAKWAALGAAVVAWISAARARPAAAA